MRRGRLHAYEVLLRVARVREIGASVALAEASAERQAHRAHCEEITAARDDVTVASRVSSTDASSLDMARYEMLSHLDAALARELQVASHELTFAERACRERAMTAVVAKRYREQMDERVRETAGAIEHERTTGRQEEAIELWLKGEMS